MAFTNFPAQQWLKGGTLSNKKHFSQHTALAALAAFFQVYCCPPPHYLHQSEPHSLHEKSFLKVSQAAKTRGEKNKPHTNKKRKE